jgi:hypothetical protein
LRQGGFLAWAWHAQAQLERGLPRLSQTIAKPGGLDDAARLNEYAGNMYLEARASRRKVDMKVRQR